MKNYLQLEHEIEQISHLNNAISILHWDISTNMPSGSAESRTNEITTLTSIVHSVLRSNKIAELIMKTSEEIQELDEWQLGNFREIKRKVFEASCIEDELQKRFVSSATACELVWREAKRSNDYNKLKPYFREVLICIQAVSKAKGEKLNCSKYDALLDKFDPERRTTEIRSVYSILKSTIPTLIREIMEKQNSEKMLPIQERISIEKQKLIGKSIMEVMGFDFTRGRLDESVHPFCGGTPYDVRLTTRYKEDNFISGLMGIIHETGHGLYEQNLPSKYKNQPVGKAKGMAVHESQSLFMEMQIGRSREFTEFLSKFLRDKFEFKGLEYSSDNIYKLITRVKPDLIRVDADEVTYPMHVILRFELEEALINGDVTLDELPVYWNNKMQEYLGITPKTDSDGCMQDIHWPSGAFGYFPAYTNGSIMASMLMENFKKINGNIHQEIIKGEFDGINGFLSANIRSLGSLKKCTDLLKDATNEEKINPEIFLKYLEEKYLSAK